MPDLGKADRHRARRVVRVADDVHQAMALAAEESERSIGREVRVALVEYLEARGMWPRPAKGRQKKGGA
jgi:hypothetical protein